MNVRRMRTWTLVLAAAIAVAACGGSTTAVPSPAAALASASPTAAPTPSPTPTPRPTPTPTAIPAPSDTVIGESGRITVPDQSFEVTLPKGWKRVKLDPASLAAIAKVFDADSDMARLLSSQMVQIVAAGIQLWAIDVSAHAGLSGAPSNLTAMGQPNSPYSLKELKAIAVAQLSGIHGISNVKTTDVKLPAGPAIRLSYEAKLNTTVGSVEIRAIQYYIVDPKFTYLLTFSCAKLDALCGDRAATAMKTFRILP
jgi:glucose/arabinose dehydrogenase